MLIDITRNRILGFWFAAVAVIIACGIAIGANVGVGTTALLLPLFFVPPGIIVALWPAVSAPTLGGILYAANTRKGKRS